MARRRNAVTGYGWGAADVMPRTLRRRDTLPYLEPSGAALVHIGLHDLCDDRRGNAVADGVFGVADATVLGACDRAPCGVCLHWR